MASIMLMNDCVLNCCKILPNIRLNKSPACSGDDDPLQKMSSYLQFLARERGKAFQDQSGIIWSNFYEDDGGLGQMTTAAKPVYAPTTSLGTEGPLVGVVGHDVRVSDLSETSSGFERLIERLIFRSSQCIAEEVDSCQLQVLKTCAGTLWESLWWIISLFLFLPYYRSFLSCVFDHTPFHPSSQFVAFYKAASDALHNSLLT